MGLRALRAAALFVVLSTSHASAGVWYVRADAAPDQGGETWGAAFDTIARGLQVAAAGDEVWVKAGSYQGNLQLRAGVALYGGFAGDEITRDARDFRVRTTTIAGAGAGSVVVGADGAVLDGFVVTGGKLTSGEGGGLLCKGTSPRIANCRIEGNRASYGGGVFCSSSSAEFLACVIRGNRATHDGGGVYAFNSTILVKDCFVLENEAYGPDTANARGGGVRFFDCLAEVDGTTFSDNFAYEGGAVASCGFWAPRFVNCLLARNFGFYGGAYAGEDDFSEFERCTIVANSAVLEPSCGGLHCVSSRTTLRNCIVWGNHGGAIYVEGTNPTPHVTYSCVDDAGLSGGTGVLVGDPRLVGWGTVGELFVDAGAAAGGDGSAAHPFATLREAYAVFSYALAPSSPCIGSGAGGATMGAELGVGEQPDVAPVRIVLAAGVHSTGALVASLPATLEGDGREVTTITGSLLGLSTGSTVKNVSVTGGDMGGLIVGSGQSPRCADAAIARNTNRWNGGGIFVGGHADPSFTSVVIEENSAAYEGGGVFCSFGATPRFEDCTFARNSAMYGGALSAWGAFVLERCTLKANRAESEGGAVHGGSGMRITDSRIEGNSAGGCGGGIVLVRGGFLITGCDIVDNDSNWGGGIAVTDGFPTYGEESEVRGCRIERNIANEGGGLRLHGDSILFADCLIAMNRAANGGAVYLGGTYFGRFDHCTIVGNVGTESMGGVRAGDSQVRIASSIVWGNGLPAIDSVTVPGTEIAYSCIEGPTVAPGVGNKNVDPRFVPIVGGDLYVDAGAAEGGDGSAAAPFRTLQEAVSRLTYALCEDSPCIGAGAGGGVMGAALGIGTCDGAAALVRVAAGTYEVGAFQLDHPVAIEGAGAAATIFNGTLLGMPTGASLRGVTIQQGTQGGVVVGAGHEVTLRECVVRANRGGGVRAGAGSVVTLLDCTIAGNEAESYGGGLDLAGARAYLRGCRVADNVAFSYGGGIAARGGADLTIEECDCVDNASAADGGVSVLDSTCAITNTSFEGNRAASWGGGAFGAEHGDIDVYDCRFSGNVAEAGAGGAMRIGGATRGVVARCAFEGNVAPRGGGVSLGSGADFALRDSSFLGNAAEPQFGEGGGAALLSCSSTLSGCTFALNSAAGGAAIAVGNSMGAVIEHATITDNTAQAGGAALQLNGSLVRLTSSIVWDNAGGDVMLVRDRGTEATYDCIEGDAVFPGQGNILADPRLAKWQGTPDAYVDASAPSGGDGSPERPYRELSEVRARCSYALQEGSPCIGAGADGTSMGADHGIVAQGAGDRVRAVLAPGVYAADRWAFARGLGAEGAGAGTTIIRGGVHGLRARSALANLTVEADGEYGIVIAPGEAPRIEGVVVRGATVGGIVGPAGAVMDLHDCVMTDNRGAALRAEGATLNVSACTIERTTSDATGAVALVNARGILHACTLRATDGADAVALVAKDGEVTLRDSTIGENASKGIVCNGGLVTLERTRLVGNAHTALEVVRAGTLVVHDGVIERNGALVAADAASVTMRGCLVVDNTGSIAAWNASVRIEECVIAGNFAAAGGMIEAADSPVELWRSTIARNMVLEKAIVRLERGDVRNSIIFGNYGTALEIIPAGGATVAYSCIEAGTLPPGTGNINADPQFAGWGLGEAVVEVGASPGGDGSAGRPFATLAEALRAFSFALSDASPCARAGEGGIAMGAFTETMPPGSATCVVRLGAGTHRADAALVWHGASIAGAGAEATAIVGTLRGMSAGSRIEDVEVRDAPDYALFVHGTDVVAAGCRFRANPGGVKCLPGSRVRAEDCEFLDNARTEDAGAGLCAMAAHVTARRCRFAGNTAPTGGALYAARSDVVLEECTFEGNRSAVQGGALAFELSTQAAMSRCRIVGNACAEGAVLSAIAAECAVDNCLLAGNAGYALACGGGLARRLVNVTVDATTRGLCAPNGIRPVIVNTIIAGTASADDAAEFQHCLRGVDPQFVRPGTYDFAAARTIAVSGVSFEVPAFVRAEGDYRLGAASPAIDAAASVAGASLDIEGNVRTCGAATDIGAHERCVRDRFRRGDGNVDGRRDVADAISLLMYLFARGQPPACVDAADGNDDGRLDIGDAMAVLMYLFGKSGALPPPFEACGEDATPDLLEGCEYRWCE